QPFGATDGFFEVAAGAAVDGRWIVLDEQLQAQAGHLAAGDRQYLDQPDAVVAVLGERARARSILSPCNERKLQIAAHDERFDGTSVGDFDQGGRLGVSNSWKQVHRLGSRCRW